MIPLPPSPNAVWDYPLDLGVEKGDYWVFHLSSGFLPLFLGGCFETK